MNFLSSFEWPDKKRLTTDIEPLKILLHRHQGQIDSGLFSLDICYWKTVTSKAFEGGLKRHFRDATYFGADYVIIVPA